MHVPIRALYFTFSAFLFACSATPGDPSDPGTCRDGMSACPQGCRPTGTDCADDPAGNGPVLSALSVLDAPLSPAFSPQTTLYSAQRPTFATTVQLQATPLSAGDTLQLGGAPLTPGAPSAPIALTGTVTMVALTVTAPSGATRTYSIAVTRGPIGYLKASNTGAGDNFGTSLALSGDTLAVGAPLEDSSATGVNGAQGNDNVPASGAVYVFTRTAGVWSQQAYLKASNTDLGDRFGKSLALSGDTLAVGAPLEDSSATGVGGNQDDGGAADSGAVYVFTRTGGTWSQQAYLKASNTDAGDNFGTSVALSEGTLAVGADAEDSKATGVGGPQTDNTASASGAVYVFTRTGAAWSQQAYLKASNAEASDAFGRSIALSGDTLAVGAIGEASSATGIGGNQADNGASFSGAVYVFTRTGGTWSQQAYLKASNASAGDFFGTSVALSEGTLAVGAVGEDSSATGVGGDQADNRAAGSGAVYLFTRAGAAWSQQAYLKPSNTNPSDAFGTTVALSEGALAVGAVGEDSSATGVGGDQKDDGAIGSGAVYLFTRTGAAWSQQHYLKATNTAAGHAFGGALSLAQSASGPTVCIGAINEASIATGVGGNQQDGSAGQSGAVYVF